MYQDLAKQILEIKRKKDAVILAHYYEHGEIQDIADFVGDSLYLAQMGQQHPAPVVLLAGVVFMAETVKILSPSKTVLVPDVDAGCSLVNESPFEEYLNWRNSYPNHIMVTYINSSVEVKAISDVICTSSNAAKVIGSIPKERGILFGPDRHLGRYLSLKLDRPMVLWPGACEVHILFSARKIHKLKSEYPEARVLAHPECTESVLELADVIGSTSVLLKEVENPQHSQFIVATESGIIHQMKKMRPDGIFIPAPPEGSCGCNECPYMKLNTLEKVHRAFELMGPQIYIDKNILSRAKLPLERMMKISSAQPVQWPQTQNPQFLANHECIAISDGRQESDL